MSLPVSAIQSDEPELYLASLVLTNPVAAIQFAKRMVQTSHHLGQVRFEMHDVVLPTPIRQRG